MTTSLPADAVGPLGPTLVAVLTRSGLGEPLLVATRRPVGAVAAEMPGVVAVATAIDVSHFGSFLVRGVETTPHRWDSLVALDANET